MAWIVACAHWQDSRRDSGEMMELSTMIIGAGVAVVGTGTMLKFLNGRINKKQEIKTCEAIHKANNEALERGEKKFDKLLDEQEKQGKTLAGQAVTLEFIGKSLDKLANGK